MIELKRRGKEKRARRVWTRPEPTIIGNCEGWSFIVGKKFRTYSPNTSHHESLQCSNRIFIHNLSTILDTHALDNLWASCGARVVPDISSRMVNLSISICHSNANNSFHSNKYHTCVPRKLVSTHICNCSFCLKIYFLTVPSCKGGHRQQPRTRTSSRGIGLPKGINELV